MQFNQDDLPKGVEIIKRLNKITVGFFENGILNGLGFILLKHGQSTN